MRILKQSTAFLCCVVTHAGESNACLGCTLLAVYNLWYSFVFTFFEAGGDNDTPAISATTPSSVATNPDLNTIRDASQTTGNIRFLRRQRHSPRAFGGILPAPPRGCG